jgi:ABC-type uncharacterized transport system permease subunit
MHSDAMPDILLYALTAAAYVAVAAFVWRTHWQPRDGDREGAVRAGAGATRWLVLIPLVLHAILLWDDLFAGPELRFGFGQALSVMLWLAVLIYWIEGFFLALDGLQALVLPVAALAAVLPAAFAGFSIPGYSHSIGFRAHLVVAMAAYSYFTIAAMQAVLMSVLERRLHSAAISGPLASLPPLLTLERVLFRLIGAGFLLLTLTILTGAIFSEEVFGRVFRLDHKTLFAIISWVIFAALLVGRRLRGWRGRTALRWLFAGFLTLLLAYVGSRFVLEVVLRRAAE